MAGNWPMFGKTQTQVFNSVVPDLQYVKFNYPDSRNYPIKQICKMSELQVSTFSYLAVTNLIKMIKFQNDQTNGSAKSNIIPFVFLQRMIFYLFDTVISIYVN